MHSSVEPSRFPHCAVMLQAPLWTLGTLWIREWSFLLFFFLSYSIVLLVSEASLHILPTEREGIWERETEFKELAHKFLGAGKSKSTEQASRLETQRRVQVSAWAQSQSAGRIPSSLRNISLFSWKIFHWLDEVHLHYKGWPASLKVYWILSVKKCRQRQGKSAPFPHTLPCVSIPSDYSWVTAFYNKLETL